MVLFAQEKLQSWHTLQTWLRMAMWWNAQLLRSAVPDQLVCSDRDLPWALCIGYHTAGALQGLFVLSFCYFLGKICNVSLRYMVSPFTFPIWENELVPCHSSPFFSIIFCLPSCYPKRTLSAGWWASTRLCCASLWCRHHNAASPLCL